MTRMERKRRRKQIVAHLAIVAFLLALIVIIVGAQGREQKAVEREPYNPPPKPIAEIKAEIAMRADHPNRFYYRQEIPLGRYQQETLWNAAEEWGVPYELAVAVCWRETNFRDLVTTNDTGTYYGMMAVRGESAERYMELCGVEYLNSEEDRLRVGCCILGEHIRTYGITRGLMAYNAGGGGAAEQWALGVYHTTYTMDVLDYMEGLME